MLLARAAARFAVWAAGLYYRLEVDGPSLPDGPVIIVSNHPNMLMDPLLALHVARRPVRTFVKAPHFRTPIFGWVLRRLGALPVYRVRDDPRRLARNKTTFRHATQALEAGGALLIFPEGGSDLAPALRPLKAGAARTALTAESASDWTMGLKIVPIGLTYPARDRFRSSALALTGESLTVADWRGAFESDRTRAIRELTETAEAALRAVTRPNLADRVSVLASRHRSAATHVALLVIGAPLAALGTLLWFLPFAAAWLFARLARPDPVMVATIKLLAGIVAFPATYLLWLSAAAVFGIGPFLGMLVGAPVLFFLMLWWYDSLRDLTRRRDVRNAKRTSRTPEDPRLLETSGLDSESEHMGTLMRERR